MKTKWKSENKAKFSDEQIRMLESMFKNEARPELQMKQQMAAQLGLQPRQVAIWFQNKRARSKSKLLVQEYYLLKGRYDDLAPKVEALKKENQHLLDELQKLRNLIRDQQGSSNDTVEQSGKPNLEEFDNMCTNTAEKEDERNKILLKGNNNENHVQQYTDSTENMQYYAEETDLLDFPEVVSFNHLTPCESWGNLESSFESNFFFDQPSSRSQRWEY